MFDGTLGTWNNTPVELKLKDNVKSVCFQPYPVPRLYEAMFKKEFKILVSLEVLEHSN